MGERYSRLFTLPNNIYSVGAPVLIAAGALLKDNITGKVLAQLKLQSISNKPIKAASVRIFPKDTAGDALGESVSYQYLDIDIKRNGQFGQTVPIPLSNPSTRSFSAAVSDVIFADNTKWYSSTAAWEPLPAPELLGKKLNDAESINQFRIEYGNLSSNFLTETKDLWFCVCGAINRENEAECCNCHNKLAVLRKADLADIEQKKTERLERIASKKAAVKKVLTKAAIIIAAAVIIVVSGYFAVNAIVQNNAYNAAAELMNCGNYKEAILAFKAMDGYKDSAQQIEFCRAAIAEQEEKQRAAIAEQEEKQRAANYNNAMALFEEGKYDEAMEIFTALDSYKDSKEKIVEIPKAKAYAQAEQLLAQGKKAEAAIAFGKAGDYKDARKRSFAVWDEIAERDTIGTEIHHTVALKTDGTVVAGGRNSYGKNDVSGWKDIVAVAVGYYHTVGLKADGTVVAVGNNDDGQCNVSGWTDIVAVAAGDYCTVGLKANGTVVAVGYNKYGQCDVSRWTDIVAVAAGWDHTVGLKADGTVVAVGNNDDGQCNVSRWKDIVAFAADWDHTVGLKADGTVVAVGDNKCGQCDVSRWTDIVAVLANTLNTYGLKADGTVVVVGANDLGRCNVSGWTDIVAVAVGYYHTVGLKADGTVVAVGYNDDGQCDVFRWKNIKLPKK